MNVLCEKMRKEMSSCLKLERHFEDILNGVLFILNGFVQDVFIKDVLNLYQRDRKSVV